MEAEITRRLAAILSADVAGYSRLMAEDEEATLRTLKAYRGVLVELITEHGGRVFGTAGDSVIAEFNRVVSFPACRVFTELLWQTVCETAEGGPAAPSLNRPHLRL